MNHASHKPAWRCGRSWAVLVLVTIGALAIDLWSKDLAFRRIAGEPVLLDREEILQYTTQAPQLLGHVLPSHAPVVVVPSVLEFTLVLNPGAVFGMGPGQRWFFLGFTGVAIAFALYMFAFWTHGAPLSPPAIGQKPSSNRGDWFAHVAIGLLISGGLGNFYDRMIYGCVRDFIHPLPGVKWPFGLKLTGSSGEIWPYVSNVADAFLLIGIGILAVRLWRSGEPPVKSAPAPSGAVPPVGGAAPEGSPAGGPVHSPDER